MQRFSTPSIGVQVLYVRPHKLKGTILSKSKEAAKSSFPLFSILGVVFIVFKLTGWSAEVASWSWFWVLSPFWLPLAVVLALLAIFFLVALMLAYFDK